jgi:hypothetical protein
MARSRSFSAPAIREQDPPLRKCVLMRTRTGYGHHGDYVFGWKGDALQRAMDARCNVGCPILRTQSFDAANRCTQKPKVAEAIDGCTWDRAW